MRHNDGSSTYRLPASAHTSRPWRIHRLVGDFRLEDVWALPTPGGPNDFPRLLHTFAANEPSDSSSHVARLLWAVRWKLGAVLGWDDRGAGRRMEATTIRDRLPADLRDAPPGPDRPPFTPLYLIEDEWAAELINATVHAVMHLSWVPEGSGLHRGQMAVLVKPNGRFGTVYMAVIKPLRHLFVYPALLRQIERRWQAREGT